MSRRSFGLWAVGLGAVTFALFAPAAGFDFVYLDDSGFINDNLALRPGLTPSTVAWALRTSYLGWWHPLTWLSHLADVSLFGWWAGGHHLTSVAIHAVSAALAAVLLRGFGLGPRRALFAAALFAWHPLRVESVAWLSERKDVLSTLCALLALLSWQRYLARGSRGAFAGAVALHALGLTAKSMLVTFPLLLLLLDGWTRRPLPWPRRLLEKAPFFGLSLASGLITLSTQSSLGAVLSTTTFPIAQRFGPIPLALMGYLRRTVWPVDLSCHYSRHLVTPGPMIAAALAVALGLAALWWARARVPHLVYGLAFFVVPLAPVSGILQTGGQLLADRYSYLGSLGLFAGLVATVPAGLVARHRRALGLAAAGTLAVLAALTSAQLQVWRDTETLLGHALEVEPDNPIVHACLGEYLLRAGRPEEAIDHLTRTAGLMRPARGNLGLALEATGRLPEAAAQLNQALLESPGDLQIALNLARVFGALGRVDDAVRQLAAVDAAAPERHAARLAGQLLADRGRAREALPWLRRAIDAEPRDASLRAAAGAAEARLGRYREAVEWLEGAATLAPEDAAISALLARARNDLAAAGATPP